MTIKEGHVVSTVTVFRYRLYYDRHYSNMILHIWGKKLKVICDPLCELDLMFTSITNGMVLYHHACKFIIPLE